MPQRQSVKKIVSEEMQGSDSYIVVASPTVEEMKGYRDSLIPIQERIEQLEKDGAKPTDTRLAKAREELNAVGETLITRFVKDWNWVDNDGNPLPKPSEAGAVSKLTLPEINWVVAQLDFGSKEKKA